MAFFVKSHSPDINATGVYRNSRLSVTFNKRIRTASVDWQKLTVHDSNSFTTLPGTLSLGYNASGWATTIYFTPSNAMLPHNKYTLYVYGKPNGVIAYDNEQLTNTYFFEFTTGTGLYDITESGGLPSGEVGEEELDFDLSGISETIETGITSFRVYSTEPKHQTPNVSINNSGITIIFTGDISTSLSEISGYVSVEDSDVLT